MPQVSLSQDLDARFSVFLNPIRDLTKNWEVDIAKYLEEYLEELAEVQITFNGGETVMNFAQAAMLIQGSATVYSKKVEFLWQMVLQMLDLLSSRQTAEGRGGAGKEAGGSSKVAVEVNMEFNSVDNITEGRNIDLRDDQNDDDVDHSKRRGLRLLPATPLHLVEKDGEKSRHRVALVMRGGEIFGAKDDFRLNRSYLTTRGVLCMEVPVEILRGAASSSAPDQCEEEEDHLSLPPSPLPPGEDQPEEPPGVLADDAAADNDDDCGPPPDSELPGEDQQTDQEKNNKEEEAKKDLEKEETPNNNNLTVIDLPNGRYGLRRRGGEKEAVVATLKLTEPWKPLDPHAESPAKRPLRAVRLRRPPACACHRPSRTLARRKDVTGKNKTEADSGKKSLPTVESYITGELAGKVGKVKDEVPAELQEEVNREVAKRLEVGRQKRVRDLVRAGAGQDVDEVLQKVAEEKEMQQQLDRQLDDPLDCDGAADLDCEGDEPAFPPLFLPEPHNTTQMPESISKRLNDSQFDEPTSDYEALVQKWVSDYIMSAQEQINSSDLARRVNKWRDNITPKLQQEENRQEFDIHSYGSQVLSHFPSNGRKQTIPFSTVVRGQDPKEVSRLFLSCLMLANTHNIGLSNSCPGDMAMDCLELTLMSRVRHHEELQEYYAPSQATTPRRKGQGGGLGCALIGDEPPVPTVCADITHTALAGHNLPTKHSRNRPKAKSRPR